MTKHEVRKALLASRKKAHAHEKVQPSEGAFGLMADWLQAQIGDAASVDGYVGSYQPIATERDPGPLTDRLNLPLAFPRVLAPAQPLAFFVASAPRDFAPGAFGVLEPLPCLPQVVPAVILVPLVGFDRAGYRLGYGGGFYDRTLAKFRALRDVVAVGFAYDAQLSATGLNFESTDMGLDGVMTPTRLYEFGAEPKVTLWS